jgi:hypothetical protein
LYKDVNCSEPSTSVRLPFFGDIYFVAQTSIVKGNLVRVYFKCPEGAQMCSDFQHGDTQHNNTKLNDTQHDDKEYNDTHYNDKERNDNNLNDNTSLSLMSFW